MDTPSRPLNVMLVDDEQFAREDLRDLIAEYPNLQVLWEAASLKGAREILRQHTPDLLLLDIQLRDGVGFDLLGEVGESTHVVFVSGYDEYAVRAFEVNAFDYLLKPVKRSRFERTLERVLKRRCVQTVGSQSWQLSKRITVRSGNRTESLESADIIAVFCFGGNYTEVATTQETRILTRRTVMEWEELLPKQEFVRVHRSAIASVRHVVCLRSHYAHAFELQMRHLETPISVSRRLVPQVRSALESWCGYDPTAELRAALPRSSA